MDETHSAFGFGSWSRMLAVLLLLATFVIVPFVIWGDRMDIQAPKLMQSQATQWAIALTGIALLVLDVLLPIPSSVVSISLCFLLGPAWGALAVFVGMVGAFAVGFLVGRLLPTSRLRRWVGGRTWDAVASARRSGGLLWIATTRPIPVLAEVAAVFAGTSGIPFVPALAAASVSSLLVASAYGFAAWMGLNQLDSSLTLLVISAAFLPAASWAALRWLRR